MKGLVRIASTPDNTVKELADWLLERVKEAVRSRGFFSIAFSGGSTPKLLFQHLALPEVQEEWPWERAVVFWCDERAVPPTHPASNFGMTWDLLLKNLQHPPEAIYRWMTGSDPQIALADYRRKLASLAEPGQMPSLDIALLGIGQDGHTASLFPNSPALNSTDWVAYGPGPGTMRYTITVPLLNRTKETAFLVTGRDKSHIVAEILDSGKTPRYPAERIQPDSPVHWFLDEDAAQSLQSRNF